MIAISFIIGFLFNGLILPGSDIQRDTAFPQNEQEEKKVVVLCWAKSFEAQVVSQDAIYVVKHRFNLNGNSIVIPKGCELVFDGGELKNGLVIGQNTRLVYQKPFLNRVKLAGALYR